ncbi:MAG TPA: helix-turn-helix domain-containing protein [Isosphaeraceae bacterium]|nr:helix-turn-helix domain-containing protein [Isosphaeraceae bacterium]
MNQSTQPETLAPPGPLFRPAEAPDSRPAVDRLTYRLDEVAASLGVSRRAIERERAAGRFPAPDVQIGKMPLWRRDTLVGWIAQGGAR